MCVVHTCVCVCMRACEFVGYTVRINVYSVVHICGSLRLTLFNGPRCT